MAFYKRCEMQGFTFKSVNGVKCICDMTGEIVRKEECRKKDCYKPQEKRAKNVH